MMMGGSEESERPYNEYVGDLQKNLEDASHDVRENLKVSQRHQKDAYHKGLKHTRYYTTDLFLRYTPRLKPEETGKFHRQ